MKLCDVNIFVHAHCQDSPNHIFYNQWLLDTLAKETTFLYYDTVFSAFLRIVTHPKIYKTPTPIKQALAFINDIRGQPNTTSIMPGANHWEIFQVLCNETNAGGNLIPDAYLAALAVEANVEWITADTDFAQFEPTLCWHLLKPHEIQ